MTTTYIRQRGETITLAVADDGAVDGGEALVTAKLRRLRRAILDHAEPVAGTCAVSFRAADATFPVGWTLTLSAAASAVLDAGKYQIDLKIETATGVYTITNPAIVIIQEPATL